MKERPILFSGPMVRAILEGRKTQTRRVMKPQPTEQVYNIYKSADFAPRDRLDDQAPDFKREIHCPYGGPGDRLWVREAHAVGFTDGGDLAVDYFADGKRHYFETDTPEKVRAAAGYINDNRRPSIHMWRWASRITLEIADVRVERVQQISEADALAEGVQVAGIPAAMSNRAAFAALWEQINGARPGCSWADNPWVWVLTLKRVR